MIQMSQQTAEGQARESWTPPLFPPAHMLKPGRPACCRQPTFYGPEECQRSRASLQQQRPALCRPATPLVMFSRHQPQPKIMYLVRWPVHCFWKHLHLGGVLQNSRLSPPGKEGESGTTRLTPKDSMHACMAEIDMLLTGKISVDFHAAWN